MVNLHRNRSRIPRVLGSLLVLAAGVLGTSASAGAATSGGQAPYSDPQSNGSIGLCNQAGQQITSGSISATPFAWRAVSTVAPPPPYNNDGRTAILMAYQPRQGLPSGEWSGQALTASARYSNPAVPMAQATAKDLSLANFLAAYPTSWNGFVQLRMYFGTSNAEQYTAHYPSLDVQVTGSTWHAVGGASVNCTAGTAISIETILLPTTTTTAPPATTTTTSKSAASSTTTTHPTKGAATATTSATSAGAGASTTLITVSVIVAILIVGVLAWFFFRRQPGGPPS